MTSKIKKLLCVSMLTSFIMFAVHAEEPHIMAGNLYGTWQYVDFNVSMKADQFVQQIEATIDEVGVDGWQMFNDFKALYEKNNLTRIMPQEELRIPKIIHFIWLGSPLPDELKPYVNSWIKAHPDGWKFQLWTDESVKKIRLINQDLFDAATNPGMKSDMLRCELVYRFGGLYVDTDFECLQPVDLLHHTYDFYAGLHHLDTGCVQVGNALIAARPGHPILKHFIDHQRENVANGQGIPQKTGPVALTKSVYALAGKTDNCDMVFPASYFFPLGCLEKVAYRSKWKAWGSFGVHWWSKTWMDPQFRPTRFSTIDNHERVKTWND